MSAVPPPAPFQTLRLSARAATAADAPLYAALFGAAGAGLLARDLQDHARHCVAPWVLSHAGQAVGVAGFRIGFAEEGFELSFHFLPEVQGQGLASEVVTAALDHAARVLRASRVYARLTSEAEISRRVLEKAGFCDAGVRDGVPELALSPAAPRAARR